MSLEILVEFAVRAAGILVEAVFEGLVHAFLDRGPRKHVTARRAPTVIFSPPRAPRRR